MEKLFDYLGGAMGGGAAVLGGLVSGIVLFYPECSFTVGDGVSCVNLIGWDVFGMVGNVPVPVAAAAMTFFIGIGVVAYNAISKSQ